MASQPLVIPRLPLAMTLFFKHPAEELLNFASQLSTENRVTTYEIKPALSLKSFMGRSDSGKIINLTLPDKKFADDAEAISYKEGFVNGEPPTAGCCITNYHIIQKRLKASTPVSDNYIGLLLKKTSNDKWMIYDTLTSSFISPQPNIIYSFVTMPDNTIRIAACAQGAHSLISNLAPYVRYAGEVQFDEQQQIKSWNNNSGSYQPNAALAHQAGFESSSFCDHTNQNHKRFTIK